MQHAHFLKLVAHVYTMVRYCMCTIPYRRVTVCERLKFRNILPKLRRRRGAYTSRGTTASSQVVAPRDGS